MNNDLHESYAARISPLIQKLSQVTGQITAVEKTMDFITTEAGKSLNRRHLEDAEKQLDTVVDELIGLITTEKPC